jgi:hypothetical protein
MANSVNGAAAIVREEDLDDMSNLEREIDSRVQAAHDDGRVYMMSQYVRILAMVRAETKRIRDRFDRESLAARRREHKALKEQQRGATTGA